MNRFLLFIFALLIFAPAAQADWVQIQLKERAYVDGQGNVLQSIEGRKNRKGIDEFKGGGKDGYPEVKEVNEWHEKGTTLLIDSNVTVKAPKAASVKTVTAAEAEQMKKDVFKVEPPLKAKSGVTD